MSWAISAFKWSISSSCLLFCCWLFVLIMVDLKFIDSIYKIIIKFIPHIKAPPKMEMLSPISESSIGWTWQTALLLQRRCRTFFRYRLQRGCTLRCRWRGWQAAWRKRLGRLWCPLLSLSIHQFFLSLSSSLCSLQASYALREKGFGTFSISFPASSPLSSLSKRDRWLSSISPPAFFSSTPLPPSLSVVSISELFWQPLDLYWKRPIFLLMRRCRWLRPTCDRIIINISNHVSNLQ